MHSQIIEERHAATALRVQYTQEAKVCQAREDGSKKEVLTMLSRIAAVLSFLIILHRIATAFQVSPDSLKEILRKIDILTEEIERLKLGEVSEAGYEPQRGLGPAASKVYGLKKAGVSLAGYGEMVYENYAGKTDNGLDATTKDKVDFLRNVLYVGFRFNEWIIFNSEVEFEHASTGKGGEVSVEFGYVDLMFSNALNVRAGMVLPPLGIVNEKHEPSTFFGTLRPQVERSIIPTTWRANGIGAYGELTSSLDYGVYLVEGLLARSFSDMDGVRGGRQNGANALADDLGLTGNIEYSGFSGGLIGTSFYAGNSGQGVKDSLGELDAFTTIISVHGEFSWGGIELRALYAQVSIDQAGRVSKLAGKTVASSMNGWYVVAGFDLIPHLWPGSPHYLAPYIQYENLNTQREVPSGFTRNAAGDRSILTVGLSHKPHPNVAFKFDYRDNSNQAMTALDQWNFAVNYLF